VPKSIIKSNPKPASTDFAVFQELVRDEANHVYRDGKSHARIGVGRAN